MRNRMAINSSDFDQVLLNLKQYWGFDSLRPSQEPIVKRVLSGENVVALLPTGGGKSICFQLPGLCMSGLTIVISPLVALMEDQVAQLVSKGINAAALHSGMSAPEMAEVLSDCQSSELKFLYCSPERLQSDFFKSAILNSNVSLVAIDEAHCISQWGYDFRPDYLKIKEFLCLLSGVQLMALTASATHEVLSDIIKQLNLPEEAILRSSFARQNLAYQVQRCENKTAAVLRVCREYSGSGILYCQTRGECVWWADYLMRMGIQAAPYHAGLSHDLKMTTFEKWKSNELKLVCATSAFGMGIDKPDVRFVLHVQMPLQPEAYFQEAGRAGRDGREALSKIFWNEEDVARARKRLLMKFPDYKKVANGYDWICNACKIDSTHACGSTFNFDPIAFCHVHQIDPWLLLGYIKVLESASYLTLDLESLQFTEIKIIARPEAVRDFIRIATPEAELLNGLIGLYGRLFDRMVRVSEYHIASVLQSNSDNIRKSLINLQREGWISLNYAKQESSIRLLQPRVMKRNLILENATTKMLKQREFMRAGFMENYLSSNKCRSQLLLGYFGEADAEICGLCDVCLSMEIVDKKMFVNWLRRTVHQNTIPMRDLKSMLYRKGWKKEYSLWLRELLDDGSFLLNHNDCIELNDF